MSSRLKLMPAFLTLLAGAITSIMTYRFQYEGKTALIILLAVLLFFYTMGCILQKLIITFEQENEKERQKAAEEEGKVVEKENASSEEGEKSEKDSRQEEENQRNTE